MEKEKISTYDEHIEKLSLLERTSLAITRWVGTPYMAIAFALLAFVSLPGAIATHDAVVIVAWIAQTFLQLVLLPVIMVGQNLDSKHTEIQAKRDMEVNEESLELLRAINYHLEIGKCPVCHQNAH